MQNLRRSITLEGIALVLVTLFACSLSDTVRINFDCAFHVNHTFNNSNDWSDHYHMMNGDRLAYFLYYYHTDTEVWMYYAASNPSVPGEWDVAFSNFTHTCAEMSKTTEFLFVYDRVFEYDRIESVKCPDNTDGCHEYCGSRYCVILDSSNRLLRIIDLKWNVVTYYTYLDDVPTRDVFDVTCGSLSYTAIDYCPDPSSGGSQGSATASSITKAAVTVVVAALVMALV